MYALVIWNQCPYIFKDNRLEPFFDYIIVPSVKCNSRAFDSTLGKVISYLSNNYTMGCPSVRGDNPQALASGLSYVQVDKHGIIILYHLHQFRPCTS